MIRWIKILTASALVGICLTGHARIHDRALYEQGSEAFKAGNYGSSELLFRKIVESGQDGETRERAWYYLARSIFNQKKYKSAIFEFNRFLLICTVQQLCWQSRFWIAESHFNLKDHIRAIQEYKRFIAQSRDEKRKDAAYDRIGEIYYLQGRYDEAIIEWREAINHSTSVMDNNERVVKIGEALFQDKDYAESLKLLESLLKSRINPVTDVRARIIIGRIYQLQEKHRDALRILYGIREGLLKNYQYADAQYYKAKSALAIGDNYSARTFLDSFLLIGEESEWYYNALYERGLLYLREGKEKRGIELLERVRSNTRKMGLRSRAALILGRKYLKIDPKSAIVYLEDAVSLEDPDEQKKALLLLVSVYLEVGSFDDAERLMDFLISTHPEVGSDDKVQFLYSRIQLEKKNYNEAVKGFEKIKEINPSSPYLMESLYYIAQASERRGNIQKSMTLLKEYIRLPRVKKRYEAYVALVDIFQRENNIVESRKYMELIIKGYLGRNGVDRVIFDHGRFLYRKEDKAYLKYFIILMNRFPGSEYTGDVLVLMGDDYFSQGQYKRAERMYRQFLSVEGRKQAGTVFISWVSAYYEMGRYNDIIYRIHNRKHPPLNESERRQLILFLGRCYYKTGNYELAYRTMIRFSFRDLKPGDLVIVQESSLQVNDVATAQSTVFFLKQNTELYARALLRLGLYYKKLNQPEITLEYMERIIKECPRNQYCDDARMEIANIRKDEGRFEDALKILEDITKESLKKEKSLLEMELLLKLERYDEAEQMMKKNLKIVMANKEGENLLQKIIVHYRTQGERRQLELYINYLRRFPGNLYFVNFQWAEWFYQRDQYNTAYYFYYKVVQRDNILKEESLYRLGLISMIYQKNRGRAIGYFTRLSESAKKGDPLVDKARLNLSILLNEMGQVEKSEGYLKDILNGAGSQRIKMQAENLAGYFGYK